MLFQFYVRCLWVKERGGGVGNVFFMCSKIKQNKIKKKGNIIGHGKP